jgi:tRNA(Ile)-lysidine synthase
MEALNPSVRDAIARMAEHLSDVKCLYEDEIKRERKRIMPDATCLDIRLLMRSPAPRTVLYECLRPYGFTRTLAASVFEALHGESGKTFFTPNSTFRVIKDRDFLLLTPSPADEAAYTLGENETLTRPIRLRTEKKAVDSAFIVEKSASVASFDFDRLSFPLTLRRWQEGDRFIPFGMRGHKKLSDYFSDHKFSLLQKERTWLLCSGNDIIWIVGECTDARYRIAKHTKFALVVDFFRE